MMQAILSDMDISWQVFSEVLEIVSEMNTEVSWLSVKVGWGWMKLWEIRDNLVPRPSKNTSYDLFAGIMNTER